MGTILQAIIPIFLLITVGVILQQFLPHPSRFERLLCKVGLGTCESTTSVLNRYALFIALPALIVHSLANTNQHDIVGTNVIVFTTIILILILGLLFVGTKLLAIKPSLANTYIFGIFFGNVAYIGFPFIEALFPGSSGTVSILVAIHVAVAFSLGLVILEHSKKDHQHNIAKSLIRNPLLIAVIIGLVILVASISLPAAVHTAIGMLASSASPVVLIAVGTFMASSWSHDKSTIHAIAISFGKLLLVPLIFIGAARLSMPMSTGVTITLLESAMPVALTNFALAEIYPMNQKIIANAIIISTIAALFTLTFWSALLV